MPCGNQPLSDTAGLQQLDLGSECLCIRPHCAYMYIPGSAARSRLGNVFLEKKLGLTLTTRNANTLQKMASFEHRLFFIHGNNACVFMARSDTRGPDGEGTAVTSR